MKNEIRIFIDIDWSESYILLTLEIIDGYLYINEKSEGSDWSNAYNYFIEDKKSFNAHFDEENRVFTKNINIDEDIKNEFIKYLSENIDKKIELEYTSYHDFYLKDLINLL